jgi:hypothetical protein
MRRAKSLILLIAATLALPATLLAACAFYGVVFPHPRILTSTSPAGTYTVTLTGKAERPSYPAVVNTVWFSIVKDNKPFLAERYLHSGDWLDPSFAILYPQHSWVSENTLHFYREEYFHSGKSSAVEVINSSGEAINYLKVSSDDTYLLFDLQPKSRTKLIMAPPRGSIAYVSVEGEFSENKRIEKRGQNFRIRKVPDEPISYRIDIVGNVPLIESPQLEKYEPH